MNTILKLSTKAPCVRVFGAEEAPHFHILRRPRPTETKIARATGITFTANEIRTALNQPDQWFPPLVYVNDGKAQAPQDVRQPFTREPEFAEASRTLRIRDLMEKGGT